MPLDRRLSLGLSSFGLSVLSGILLSLAFPRPELWPLVFAGLVPLVLACRGKSLKTAFGLGFLTGLVHAGTLIYWVINVLITYGHLPVWLAAPIFLLLAGYLALYTGLFALGLVLGEKQLGLTRGGPAWVFAGAVLYTGLEYFKGFFLTGFPWESLGAALVPSLSLIQLSDIVGVGGLTFLVVLINFALAALVLRSRSLNLKTALFPAALILAVTGLLWGYGHYRLGVIKDMTARAESRKVAVVQASIDQDLKWDPSHRVPTLMTYRDLTLKAAEEKPWLIVWPETAVPFYFLRDPAATDWLAGVVKRAGRAVLFGSPACEDQGSGRSYYNRAYLLDGQGRVRGHYDKVHLVPYGEYVPLKRFFPFLGKVTQSVGDYSPGCSGKLPDLDNEKFGILICYESIFPELARAHAAAGADYLVVMTNDAWFGRSSAPYQHFSQAVLRAVENRRTVIRAANTGVSGIIQPTGETSARLDLFVRGILPGPAPRLTLKTVYVTLGDVVPQTCFGIAVLIFGVSFYRRQRHAD